MKEPVRLWIVGSIGIDDIATRNARRHDLLGGSVTFACAAASFFARVGAVGIVGDDFPEAFLARYRAFGIDLAGLQTTAGPTFRWAGAYADDMIDRRTLKTELGVFARFQPRLPETYRAAPCVLLGNIGPDLQLHVLDQASGARFVAADTMDLWIRSAPETLRQVIGRVHLLTLNDGEARLLTGRRELRDCARALLDMGPRYVVIKKGEHGAMLFSGAGVALAPAYPVAQLIDPTGAGDAFAGALMGWLASRERAPEEDDIRRGLLYGSVVASFAVEAFSLERLEGLTRRDVEERLAELRRMTSL